MNSAIRECDRNRQNRQLDCECVRFDKNGKSVLKVPDSLIARMSPQDKLPDVASALITPIKPLGADPYKVIFTTDLDDKRQPIDSISELSLKHSEVYIFVRWLFDLSKIKDPFIGFAVYDAAGNKAKSSAFRIRPKKQNWNTWTKLYLNKNRHTPGEWKLEILVDGKKISEEFFIVTE